MSQACFQLVAIDDTIVESEEVFTLIIEASNSNDIVSGNVTVVIVDNDSKEESHSCTLELMSASLHSCEPWTQ